MCNRLKLFICSDRVLSSVLSSWQVQTRRGDSARPVAPDFVSLNRDAVKSGLVTSKELSQYRAQRGGARARNPAPKQQRAPRSATIPDITFGVTTRAPSPLSDLLSHQYARRWLDDQLSRNQTDNPPQRIKPGCIPDTRTSLLRRSRPLPVTHTSFKLSRFSQVPPALDTFRDEEARQSRRGAGGPGSNSLDRPDEL
ncbi:cilia- and flagella-associated protein 77 [Larimichthys crocea]|uniref:cilia- and flagella-associated protein 77 n=1 Tax=Larimichthys crocea TaxID=215358 RepID=UPI000F5E411B|nr:cilia- and flagella-associated protein 77 [Larimichthys crocea]